MGDGGCDGGWLRQMEAGGGVGVVGQRAAPTLCLPGPATSLFIIINPSPATEASLSALICFNTHM